MPFQQVPTLAIERTPGMLRRARSSRRYSARSVLFLLPDLRRCELRPRLQQPIGAEPHLEATQFPQGLHKEPRADEQETEPTWQPTSTRPRRRVRFGAVTPARTERAGGIDVGRAPRGSESEQQDTQEGHAQREGDDARITTNVRPPGGAGKAAWTNDDTPQRARNRPAMQPAAASNVLSTRDWTMRRDPRRRARRARSAHAAARCF